MLITSLIIIKYGLNVGPTQRCQGSANFHIPGVSAHEVFSAWNEQILIATQLEVDQARKIVPVLQRVFVMMENVSPIILYQVGSGRGRPH
jgi:hypothetical protein